MICPDDFVLVQYLSGSISADGLTTVSSHVSDCTKCLERLERLEQSDRRALNELSYDAVLPPDDRDFDHAVKRLLHLDLPSDSGPRLGPGSVLRDYRILELIGEGGMGSVFKAVHTRLEKLVAVKVIRHGPRLESSARQRFDREMKAVGRLRDPRIVQATDAGDDRGVPFLVMEFVEGTNLSRLVKTRGPLAPDEAIRLIRQAADGLQHAHEAGMVHRDVKPSNLMRTPDGNVKILDLGLAVIRSEANREQASAEPPHHHAPSRSVSDLTSPSRIVGTIEYMAPEQVLNSHGVDARADVFGLGCTLWFLLTGYPPQSEWMTEHEPRPGGISHSVWKRFLAPNPDDRFPTAAAASAELAEFDSSTTLPVKRETRVQFLIALLILGVSIPTALAFHFFRKDSDPKRENDKSNPAEPLLKPGRLPMSESDARTLQANWAEQIGTKPLIQNRHAMNLALMPPGEFGLSSECRVRITKPYYITTTEVTRSQFRAFVQDQNYRTEIERTGAGGDVFDRNLKFWTENRPGLTWLNPGMDGLTEAHPVTMINRNDADAFCAWLSKTEKVTYRLPTEAEWKWACRAGEAGQTPHEGNLDALRTFAWSRLNAQNRFHPVGLLKPNVWGIYDMHGNVTEMCSDPFEKLPVGSFDDYAGANHSHAYTTVGSTFFGISFLFDERNHCDRDKATSYLGFRVVCEIPK